MIDASSIEPADGNGTRPPQGETSDATRRSTRRHWTPEEDEILRQAVQEYNGKNWKKIAESFENRTDVQCLHRWQKVLNPELRKGPWSKEEDEVVIRFVKRHGPKKWSIVAKYLPGRIGKQCRERWHHHLNPEINKEAWTEEEELILVRAQQAHGNKWAELTKYLPGRTDNAIKNHWNSSVKKKLDSYVASGLLLNLPPLVPHHQPMPSPSPKEQATGDDNGPKAEYSECNLEAAMATCSQFASEKTNGMVQVRDEVHLTEHPCLRMERSFSGTPCSGKFHSLKDVDLSVIEILNDLGCYSSSFLQNFAHETGTSVNSNCQFNLLQLPNISSLQVGVGPSGLSTHSADCNRNSEIATVPFQTSVGLEMGNVAVGTDSFSGANNVSEVMVNQEGYFNPILCQSLNIQTSESLPSDSEVPGTSHQLFLPAPSVINSTLLYGGESNQLDGTKEEGNITAAHDGFIDINEPAKYPCGNRADGMSMQEQLAVANNPPKVVPMYSSDCGSADMQTCSSKDGKTDALTKKRDAGALCHEPPRFPSTDIPFLSCDLVQSDCDMQQDFSPLGIRQFMMSSVNCISPVKLWDSPVRDDRPDATLKSAAKTFTGTPSILKNQNHDLLLPLSDKRVDKKLEIDLTKDSSRSGVVMNENVPILRTASSLKGISGAHVEEKENIGYSFEGEEDRKNDGSVSLLSNDLLEKKSGGSNFQNGKEHVNMDARGKSNVDVDADNSTVQQPSGVLVELDANYMQLFPDQDSSRIDKQLDPGIQKNLSGASPRQSVYLRETEFKNLWFTGVGSPKNCTKSISSAPLETIVDNAGKDTGFDYLNILGETPFKGSPESPSALKYQWNGSSFLSSPNMTIQDYGYLMSPGDRTYDAIGRRMKQASERTAAAYAKAQEILGPETPETLLKGRHCTNENQEPMDNSHEKLEGRSRLSSRFSMKRRFLDFSRHETPEKGVGLLGKTADNGKPAASTSPSSHLLKFYR